MANSYNGWVASRDPDEIGINTQWAVNGVRFPGGIKSGDVEIVMTNLVRDLMKIEPPTSDDFSISGMWGYEYKANVNNPNSLSCHSSGTAFDYNAAKHVNGGAPYNGWSAEDIPVVRDLLHDKYKGLVSWLANQPTPDPMHFEIHGTASQIRALAIVLADDNGGGDDDMELTPQNLRDIAKAVWEYKAPAHGKPSRVGGIGKEEVVHISTGQTIADAATYASRAARDNDK